MLAGLCTSCPCIRDALALASDMATLIRAILKNYSVITEELEQIGEESHSESSRKALGLLALMERFSTYFGLKLAFLVFSATEQASSTLQYKDINAQEAAMAIDAAKTFLGRRRSDSA